VIKAEVFQVSRRADPDRHLHLLCFIAHQYFHLYDLLMDTLLMAARSTSNVCKQEDRNQYYDGRADRREASRSLVEQVERTACDSLNRIESIAFQKRLPDAEKYLSLDDYLIPSDEGERQRDDYLEQADLTEASDCQGFLQQLAAALDQQYATTNQHILF
jgi:hypothetical protein